MQIELNCNCCGCRFAAPPGASAEEILDKMMQEGSWYSLGDGQTFEDMIFQTLTAEGNIYCPVCANPVSVSEESLSRMAMEMLSRW